MASRRRRSVFVGTALLALLSLLCSVTGGVYFMSSPPEPPFLVEDALYSKNRAEAYDPSATYSTLEFTIPRLARNDTHQQAVAGRQVRMTNVRWDGKGFVLYGPHLNVPRILTTKMHTHWYYPKYAKKGTKVTATTVPRAFDESDCTGGIVQERVFAHTPPRYCSNHYHILHDEIMPLMAAMGTPEHDFNDETAPLRAWNISEVRVMATQSCDYPLLQKPFSKILSSHPMESFPPTRDNVCFRHVVLTGSQRMNLYVPPTNTTCRDLQWWQRLYLQGLRISLPDKANVRPQLKWIARTGSREVRNRQEMVQAVMDAFPHVDIEIVKLENLDLVQQILVFVQADIILGPHGAGLAKLLFLRKGAGLLQLAPFGMSFPNWKYSDGTV